MSRLDRAKNSPEPRFDAARNAVVLSGTAKQVQRLYESILEAKYPQRDAAIIKYESGLAIANIDDQFPYQYTFGVTERVRVFRDSMGEYGPKNRVVLIYAPNSPADKREEEETVARIKATMESIGFSF